MKTAKNTNFKFTAFWASVLLLLSAFPAAGSDYKTFAENVAGSAKEHGITRIAIGAFSASAGNEEEARFAAEKMEGLLSSGGLEMLDQATLEAAANPKKGWLAGLPSKLRPQAYIKGSVFKGEDGLTVMVKLVEVASGRVIGAMEMKSAPRFTEVPSVPEMNWGAPSAEARIPNDFRDAVADKPFDCGEAVREMTRINAGAVDLKARYWAIKMKEKGFVLGSLSRNPGSELKDHQVKQKFYELLTKYHNEESAPALAEGKMKKLEEFMGREGSVIDRCGLN